MDDDGREDVIAEPDGSPADAFDTDDERVDWSRVDELAERFARVPDGDKDAAKQVYAELAQLDDDGEDG